MSLYVAGLIAIGAAGFLICGGWGAVALMMSWSAVVIACRQSWQSKKPAQPNSKAIASPGRYAEIDKIFLSLAGVSAERGWDIDKRLEIACLACEHPDTLIDELEQLYDTGVRSARGKKLQQSSTSPKKNRSS